MFQKQLDELAARHLTRRITPLHSGVGPVVEVAGRQILLLASNDYLGLAMHPEVIQSAIEATQRFGAGAGASRSDLRLIATASRARVRPGTVQRNRSRADL